MNAFCDRGYHSYQNRIVHRETNKQTNQQANKNKQEENNKADIKILFYWKIRCN